tara:strand:+ start:1002 stop:3032 length:2031 start_codon:yes stop_codon:yes gene_type:complete
VTEDTFVGPIQASPEDDATSENTTTPEVAVNTTEVAATEPLSNPLSELPSYTYNATLYMATSAGYNAWNESNKQTVDLGQVKIIAQSGGIAKSETRAEGFKLDYFIDNIKVSSVISPKRSNTAIKTTEIKFNITEQYGFSFISNLQRAGLAINADNPNPARQLYLLRLGFLGYNENGEPANISEKTSDIIYALQITEIKFKITGGSVVYNISSVIRSQEASGSKRGRLESDAQFTGSTVKELLVSSGSSLLNRLNTSQTEQKDAEARSIPNTYAMVIADEIADAPFTLFTANPEFFEGSVISNTAESTDAQNIKKDLAPQSFSVGKGISIVKIIEDVIKNSDYMRNAVITAENAILPNSDTKTIELDAKPASKPAQWFTVSVELTNPKFDPVVADYAYTITYHVNPYKTPVVTSSFINKPSKLYSPYKRYEYWFTGKNTEVMNYEQELNYLYYQPIVGGLPNTDASTQGGIVSLNAGQASGGETQNQLNVFSKFGIDDYVTNLNDPASYAAAKIKILGDPDFLMHTDSKDIGKYLEGSLNRKINPSYGQVLVEINFNEGTDYDVAGNPPGTLTPNESILFGASYPRELNIQGVSYIVMQVTSTFNAGLFSQELDLVLNSYVAPSATPTTTREVPRRSQEDNDRIEQDQYRDDGDILYSPTNGEEASADDDNPGGGG